MPHRARGGPAEPCTRHAAHSAPPRPSRTERRTERRAAPAPRLARAASAPASRPRRATSTACRTPLRREPGRREPVHSGHASLRRPLLWRRRPTLGCWGGLNGCGVAVQVGARRGASVYSEALWRRRPLLRRPAKGRHNSKQQANWVTRRWD